MIEETLLKSNYLGKDGFIWWIGQVAPASVWRNEKSKPDAGENKPTEKGKDSTGGSWAYRCKVRIIGYHTFDGNILPDNDLPWAHVTMSADNGSIQGSVGKTMMLVGGETVYGFFLDGDDAQQPVIVGCLHRNESVSSLVDEEFLKKEKSSQFRPFTGHQGKLTQGNTQVREKNPSIQGDPISSPTPVAGIGSTSLVGSPVTSIREENKPGSDQFVRNSWATQQFADKGASLRIIRETGCNDNIITKISKVIEDFINFVNRLDNYLGTYIDPILNKAIDITNEIRGFATRIVGIIKFVINNMRNGIIGLITKLFGDFIGTIVPLPQQPPIASATKNIIDIIFCVFEKLIPLILDFIINMLTNMVGKAINAPLCAVEQFVGAILSDLINKIDNLLAPIFSGLNWLLGAIGKVSSILGQVSSLAQQILNFLGCDSLRCETPIEWNPVTGVSSKGSDSWGKALKNVSLLGGANSSLDDALGYLSFFGYGGSSPYSECTENARNPKNQDDQIPMPEGTKAKNCIPPKVTIFGNGVRAQAVAIVDNSGSIISIKVTNPGRGYSKPPTVKIIDNTNHGKGAKAIARIEKGKVTAIYLKNKGSGYCPGNYQNVNDNNPSYLVTADKYSFYEGETVTYTITTTQIANGTVLNYDLSGDIRLDDLENVKSLNGSITINSNTATVSIKIKQDSINENIENMYFTLYDKSGNKVAKTTVIISNELSPVLAPSPTYPNESPPGTIVPDDFGGTGTGIGSTAITPPSPGIPTTAPGGGGGGGITTSVVGIVTSIVIDRPGYGYTGGDTVDVGGCTFKLIVTPIGSIIGIQSVTCSETFESLPEVTLNTKTGKGAELYPVIEYSPKYSTTQTTINELGVISVVDCV
jgi:hypothetical protein